MKTFIIKDEKVDNITDVVKRVKLLIINSKDEILLGCSNHNIQFPGGHVEVGEDLVEALNREIREEVGIDLNLEGANPFALGVGYYKDYPEVNRNLKSEIYYYEIRRDIVPDLAKTHYTKGERDGHFQLEYIPLTDVEELLISNSNKYGDNSGIAGEMLKLFEIYKGDINEKEL